MIMDIGIWKTLKTTFLLPILRVVSDDISTKIRIPAELRRPRGSCNTYPFSLSLSSLPARPVALRAPMMLIEHASRYQERRTIDTRARGGTLRSRISGFLRMRPTLPSADQAPLGTPVLSSARHPPLGAARFPVSRSSYPRDARLSSARHPPLGAARFPSADQAPLGTPVSHRHVTLPSGSIAAPPLPPLHTPPTAQASSR